MTITKVLKILTFKMKTILYNNLYIKIWMRYHMTLPNNKMTYNKNKKKILINLMKTQCNLMSNWINNWIK